MSRSYDARANRFCHIVVPGHVLQPLPRQGEATAAAAAVQQLESLLNAAEQAIPSPRLLPALDLSGSRSISGSGCKADADKIERVARPNVVEERKAMKALTEENETLRVELLELHATVKSYEGMRSQFESVMQEMQDGRLQLEHENMRLKQAHEEADLASRDRLAGKEALIEEVLRLNHKLHEDVSASQRQLQEWEDSHRAADAERQRSRRVDDYVSLFEKEMQETGRQLAACREELVCKITEINNLKASMRQMRPSTADKIEATLNKTQCDAKVMQARQETSFHANALLDVVGEFWRRADKFLCRWEAEARAWKIHYLFHCWSFCALGQKTGRRFRFSVDKERHAQIRNVLTKAFRKCEVDMDIIASSALFHVWAACVALGRDRSKTNKQMEVLQWSNAQKLESLICKVTMIWSSDQSAVEIHILLRSWVDWTTQEKLAAFRKRLAADTKSEEVVTKTLARWGSDMKFAELQIWFQSWCKWTTSEKVAYLSKKVAANAKLESTLNNALMRWASDDQPMQAHFLFQAWMICASKAKTAKLVKRVAKHDRSDKAMDRAVMQWGSDMSMVVLVNVFQAWLGVLRSRQVEKLQKRIAKDSKLDSVFKNAVMEWSTESQLVQCLILFRAWSDEVLRQRHMGSEARSEERSARKNRRIGRVIDTAILKWGVESDEAKLHAVVHGWSSWVLSEKKIHAQVDFQVLGDKLSKARADKDLATADKEGLQTQVDRLSKDVADKEGLQMQVDQLSKEVAAKAAKPSRACAIQ